MNLVKNSAVYNILGTGTTGDTDLQGSAVVDMSGYDGIMWIAQFHGNTNTTGGYSELYHMHSDSTSTTDMVSTTANASVSPATTAVGAINDSCLLLDVYRPLKRYVSAYVTKDSTNAVEVSVIGVQYANSKGATVQPTSTYGVIASDIGVSPTT